MRFIRTLWAVVARLGHCVLVQLFDCGGPLITQKRELLHLNSFSFGGFGPGPDTTSPENHRGPAGLRCSRALADTPRLRTVLRLMAARLAFSSCTVSLEVRNRCAPSRQAFAAAGFTVELPLLPGHGTSVEDMVPTRWSDWAAAVEACYKAFARPARLSSWRGFRWGLARHLARRGSP